MKQNEIDNAIEDAWKEFERSGEITNAASNLLSAISAMNQQKDELLDDIECCDCMGDVSKLLRQHGR